MSKITPTGRKITQLGQKIRWNVLDKKYIPARQQSKNKVCRNGHTYLEYLGKCPKCGER